MVFSTIIFICVFLPVTIIGYYIMPSKAKNYWLLIMSLLFYAWGEPGAVWVMLGSILCNYILARLIARNREAGGSKSKRLLILAVFINLAVLFVFKYLTFATGNLHALSERFPVIEIALPIGISFYTFQGLSYVIDVYRGEEAQKNPFFLALYISMFPQLIAGPIVRYRDVREELAVRKHTVEDFAAGINRFTRGLAKKAVLANQIGELADQILEGNYAVMSCPVAWLGTIAYTLQIYLDFSAYSDMAIGLGRMFGFHFLENFDYPYISCSVREFWRRWHMSLSRWFRDYLYIPMGGSRQGNVYLHLLVVFLVTGIWHGAGWGFMVWGLWHGLFVILERWLENRKKGRSKSIFGWGYTMLVVMLGWTLFRIVDIRAFGQYCSVLLKFGEGDFTAFDIRYYLTNQRIFYLLLSVLVCLPLKDILAKSAVMKRLAAANRLAVANEIAGKLLTLVLLAISFIYIINSTYNPFIYFRF